MSWRTERARFHVKQYVPMVGYPPGAPRRVRVVFYALSLAEALANTRGRVMCWIDARGAPATRQGPKQPKRSRDAESPATVRP